MYGKEMNNGFGIIYPVDQKSPSAAYEMHTHRHLLHYDNYPTGIRCITDHLMTGMDNHQIVPHTSPPHLNALP